MPKSTKYIYTPPTCRIIAYNMLSHYATSPNSGIPIEGQGEEKTTGTTRNTEEDLFSRKFEFYWEEE